MLTDTVRDNEQSLAGFARSFLSRLGPGAVQDVQDVLSDAYVAAAVRLRNDSALNVENHLAWFRRVLFLTCLEYSRQRARHASRFIQQLAEEDQLLEHIATPESGIEFGVDFRKALYETVKDDDDRQIIQLAAEGYTSEEIATRLGARLTAATVRQRKSRALEKLRPLLGGAQP